MESAKEYAREVVSSLIEKYQNILKREQEKEFLEEDTKIKFVNPLLAGLGWDVEELDEVKFKKKLQEGVSILPSGLM